MDGVFWRPGLQKKKYIMEQVEKHVLKHKMNKSATTKYLPLKPHVIWFLFENVLKAASPGGQNES